MTFETYDKARKIEEELRLVRDAEKAWSEIKWKSDLGHKQHWNNDHLVNLPHKHIPDEAFAAFKAACLCALAVRRQELKDEMAEL